MVIASLEAYYAKGSEGDALRPAPSIFFSEGTGFIHPFDGNNHDNTGHNYYRIASSAAQQSLLNTTSIIFAARASCWGIPSTRLLTTGIGAFDALPRTPFHRALYFGIGGPPSHSDLPPYAAGDSSGPLGVLMGNATGEGIPLAVRTTLLLPPYLRTASEEQEAAAWCAAEGMAGGCGPLEAPRRRLDELLVPLFSHPQAAAATNRSAVEALAKEALRYTSANSAVLFPAELFAEANKDWRWRGMWRGGIRKPIPAPIEIIAHTGHTLPDILASEADGHRGRREVMTELATLLGVTGDSGCGAYACGGKGTENATCSPAYKAQHRRCTRPHVPLAVATGRAVRMSIAKALRVPPANKLFSVEARDMSQFITASLPPDADVAAEYGGYGRRAWVRTVRVLSREAKRLRRDFVAARAALRVPNGTTVPDHLTALWRAPSSSTVPPPSADLVWLAEKEGRAYAYVVEWRRRVVALLSVTAIGGATPASALPPRHALLEAFFSELMAALLETFHRPSATLVEAEGARVTKGDDGAGAVEGLPHNPRAIPTYRVPQGDAKSYRYYQRPQLLCYRRAHALHIGSHNKRTTWLAHRSAVASF